MEEIRLTCPCGTELVTAASNAGHSVVCPVCNREVPVPRSQPAAAPPHPTPAPSPAPAGTRQSKIEDQKTKTSVCPFCREPIQPDARKCPHCQEYLDPKLARAARPAPKVSATALASFVIALISPAFLFVPGVLAFMLGVLGLLATGKGRASGRALALYGTLLGLLWTCVLVLLLTGLAAAIQHGPPAPLEPLF